MNVPQIASARGCPTCLVQRKEEDRGAIHSRWTVARETPCEYRGMCLAHQPLDSPKASIVPGRWYKTPKSCCSRRSLADGRVFGVNTVAYFWLFLYSCNPHFTRVLCWRQSGKTRNKNPPFFYLVWYLRISVRISRQGEVGKGKVKTDQLRHLFDSLCRILGV